MRILLTLFRQIVAIFTFSLCAPYEAIVMAMIRKHSTLTNGWFLAIWPMRRKRSFWKRAFVLRIARGAAALMVEFCQVLPLLECREGSL